MGKASQEYLAFWKQAYLRDDPWEAVLERDGPWPKGLREALGDYALLPPEPFYGFLNDLDEESRKRDVLMLFINPGHVDRTAGLAPRWLKFHRRRYLEWTREDYLQECGVQDRPGEIKHQEPCACPIGELYEEPGQGCQWRRQRFGQARNNVGWGELRFLHTMEYSFYHSDKWSDLSPYHRWIRERPTTRLAMDALREIAEEKLVGRIITIGKDWRDVLRREPEVKLSRQVAYLTERGGYSHRMYQYAVGSDALPIVTYISGAGAIQFPAEERAVHMLDRLTEKMWEDQEEDEETFGETSETSETAEESVSAAEGRDPGDVVKRYLKDIRNRLHLPDGEYTKTGPRKGKDKFSFMHVARKSNPIWDINLCMMKIRAYCSRAPLSTRVEFGFSQDKANLCDSQKDYLRGVFHEYAKLHGLMEYRKLSDKQFYNVYAEFEGGPEAVTEQTAVFFRKLLEVAEGFINAIHKGDEEQEERNDRR